MKTRTGKIARLPRLIRDELNQRLDNGEEGKKLVCWLNRMPEVRAVMKESFEGKPVTEQNLSEWKAGGFAEWVGRQESLGQAWDLAEEAEDLRSVLGKGQSSFPEHLSTVLAMRYAKVLKEWQGEAGEAMTKQLRLLHGLSHDVARLARVGLERQRVELTREKSQAELVELFSEWMEIPAVREVVCEDYVSVADRKRVLGQRLGQEEVQGPRFKVQGNSEGRRQKRRGNKKHSTAEPRSGNNIQRPTPKDNFTSEPLKTKSGRRRWLKDPTTCDGLGRSVHRTEAEAKAARQAWAQKRMDEDTARGHMRMEVDWKKNGAGKSNSKSLTPALCRTASKPLGRDDGEENGTRGAFRDARGGHGPRAEEMAGNPGQSDLIVPAAMEAEIARLNAGGNGLGDGNYGNEGNYGRDERAADHSDWDEEDERIVKEAEEARKRRETAGKEAEQKRIDEENRLWRVQCRFEEPTAEDIALGRVKVSNAQSP